MVVSMPSALAAASSSARSCADEIAVDTINIAAVTDSAVPVQVQGLTSGVTAIGAGGATSCAIVNGSARCWGYNVNYNLGNNSTTGSLVPVQVQGITSGATAITVSAAGCAIVNGTARCWGFNYDGQAGTNTAYRQFMDGSGVPIPEAVPLP